MDSVFFSYIMLCQLGIGDKPQVIQALDAYTFDETYKHEYDADKPKT